MVGDKEKYRSAALANFTAFREAYGYSGNFWRLGNSFDMIIDYFDIITRTDSLVFAEYARDAFKKGVGHWYDDFEWWAIACLRASARPDLFGDHVAAFKTITGQCWNFVHAGKIEDMEVQCAGHAPMGGAPQVWATSQAGLQPERFARLKPRVEGGVWNCDWYWPADRDDACFCVPFMPEAKDGLGGFQNTVTNASYLIAASRLAAGSTDARLAADRQYQFFRAWFAMADDQGLLRAVANNASFVRERVGSYCNGDESHAYYSDLAWAGDQGLLIAGLIDYGRITDDETIRIAVRLVAQKLVLGTRSYLKDADGLLSPWKNPQNDGKAPGDDPDDYMTGPGIFMRGLLHAYRHDISIRTLVQGEVCQDFLRRNGDDACRMPERDVPYEKQLITLTNRIATLTAAYAMLND